MAEDAASDEDQQTEEESEGLEEQTLESEADDTGASDAGDDLYGQVVDNGTLDLQNWMACTGCRAPVEKSWDRCPSCNTVVRRPL